MNTSTTGINLIKKHESCSLSVYADANGYPTVGWGHLLSSSRTYTPNKALSNADSKKNWCLPDCHLLVQSLSLKLINC